MSKDLDDRYRRILAKQLVMNKDTWAALRAHGVTETTELSLDFAFLAPSRANAEALRAVLVDQTDYDVQVKSDGSLFPQTLERNRLNKPTAISAEILDQWVTWMVTAGVHENCEFDGWGAAV